MRKWLLLGFLALVLAVVPAMADQIDGLASSSQSVPAQLQDLYVNPGGMGDVLIFPYYNARTGVNYFKIVNTSDKGIVGKLRLREGKESEEVLDFIVCLSPHDEFSFWVVDPAMVGLSGNTAAVLRGNSGTGLMADTDTIVAPGGWTVAYTRTTTSAGKAIPADRTFEGYIEFFALNAIDVASSAAFHQLIPDANACLAAATGTLNGAQFEDAPNALVGEGYIFNLSNLLDSDGVSTYAYKAVALANFENKPLFAGLTTDRPLFADAAAGLQAVNYVLTKSNLYVLYDLQSYLQGQTDVILNFVTKKENVDNLLAGQYYNPSTCTSSDYTKCCVTLTAKVYDDKENYPTSGVDFSPTPPGQQPKVCNEVTYLPVGASATPIFNTDLHELNVNTSYELGWARLSFNVGSTTLGDSTVEGQPVLAYQIQSYFGGVLDHMLPVSYDLVKTTSEEQQASCDADHLDLCKTQEDCNNAGGFWYDNACHPCNYDCGNDIACIVAEGAQCQK